MVAAIGQEERRIFTVTVPLILTVSSPILPYQPAVVKPSELVLDSREDWLTQRAGR
jgi:hypothetical protein